MAVTVRKFFPAYDVFENRKDHVIKAAVVPDRQM